MKKLLEKQDNKRSADLKKCYITDYSDRSKRKYMSDNFEPKWGDLYPIAKAIHYLSFEDKPSNLLFVCKKWNQNLEKEILKIYLLRDNNKLIRRQRVQLWMTILKYVKILN